MRKGLGFIAGILSFVLVTAPLYAAAPKTGAKCSKAGATSTYGGIKYTCVKSGSKLAWNKGVPVKVPAPKPSEIPTPDPTPPQVIPSGAPNPNSSASSSPSPKSITQRWSDLDSNALKVFTLWSENLLQGTPKTKIEYWFGPTISESLASEAKLRMNNAVLQWERFFSTSRTKVYFDLGLYADKQEICKRIAARSTYRNVEGCLEQIKNSESRILYHAAAWESEGGWVPIADPKLSQNALVNHHYALEDELIFYSSSFLPRIEHEWFHQIQFDLTGNHYIREYPCWFVEGSAEYFGSVAALQNSSDDFLQHRAMGWLGNDEQINLPYLRKWVEQASVARLPYGGFDDACSRIDRPEMIYLFGAILTEWLIGKIGIQQLMELLKATESLGWKQSFKKYVGKTSEDSLDEMAAYLYREQLAMKESRSWLELPQCKTYREASFRKCVSFDIRRGQ